MNNLCYTNIDLINTTRRYSRWSQL